MIEFSKEIKIDSYNKVKYDISSGYSQIHTITASNIEESHHHIKFNKWDDYCFNSYYQNSYEEYINLKKESHIFKKNHPLYLPLLHLLNGENELIIDDDEASELNKKYMKIYIDGDNINIDFINQLKEDPSFERFNVFIKNIGFDLRSKIDCFNKDTKKRLDFFFKEVYEIIALDNHQITIEEYLNNNNLLTVEESKKYVKKLKY